jgi:hypothetical protein
VNPPKLTILTADTDAACDPETGTCTIPQTPIPSPAAAPVTGGLHSGKCVAASRRAVLQWARRGNNRPLHQEGGARDVH